MIGTVGGWTIFIQYLGDRWSSSLEPGIKQKSGTDNKKVDKNNNGINITMELT